LRIAARLIVIYTISFLNYLLFLFFLEEGRKEARKGILGGNGGNKYHENTPPKTS
jgi:hypothetical protein